MIELFNPAVEIHVYFTYTVQKISASVCLTNLQKVWINYFDFYRYLPARVNGEILIFWVGWGGHPDYKLQTRLMIGEALIKCLHLISNVLTL